MRRQTRRSRRSEGSSGEDFVLQAECNFIDPANPWGGVKTFRPGQLFRREVQPEMQTARDGISQGLFDPV
jgi:hypothetical protein